MRHTLNTAPLRAAALGSVLACVLPHPAHGAVLVSNLGEPTRAATIIQQDSDPLTDPPIDLPWAAQSFSTDGNAYSLQSIDVLLGRLSGAPAVVAELHADDGGTGPGGLLAAFTFAPIAPGAPVLNSLTPTTAVSLAAGTTYWLVLGAFGSGSYQFEYAEGNASIGVGVLGSYAYSNDQGASWANYGADNPYKLRVNVARADVDAPAAWASALAGALALVFRGRRRAA